MNETELIKAAFVLTVCFLLAVLSYVQSEKYEFGSKWWAMWILPVLTNLAVAILIIQMLVEG